MLGKNKVSPSIITSLFFLSLITLSGNAFSKANQNFPPFALDQSYYLNENTSLGFILAGTDPDEDPIVFSIEEGPLNGVLTGNAPNLVYVPNPNFYGNDSFTFKTNDGQLDSNIATQSFIVSQVSNDDLNPDQGNLAPECRNAEPSVPVIWPPNHKFTTVEILGISDVEGEITTEIQCIKQDEPLNSTGDGNFVYDGAGVGTSAASLRKERKGNSNGRVYHISFIATDENQASCGGVVQVAVPHNKNSIAVDEGPLYDSVDNNNSNCETENINNSPSAIDQSVTLDEDATLDIILAATDPDQNLMTFTLVEGPSNGVLTGDAPNLIYEPTANYYGDDSFTFKVNDGENDSNIATISLVVNPVNDAPLAESQSLAVNEDSSLTLALSGSDVDGDSVVFSLIDSPANGVLTGIAPNLVYVPASNYHGNDTFTFKVNDGLVDSSVATVSIDVKPVNDAPVAQAQSWELNEDSTLALTLGASDVDGDSLDFNVSSDPINGTLAGIAPNLTYTPNADYNTSTINVTKDSVYTDQGATATDNIDGDISAKITVDNSVNTTLVGTYSVIYTVADAAGNEATLTRTVNVTDPLTGLDVTPPVITILGDNPMIVFLGEAFVDPSATALDDRDGSLGVGFTNNVNVNALGNYQVIYNATDSAGNRSEATRIVNVKDPAGNREPTANAGDDLTIGIGESATLDASQSSDVDGSIASFEWKEGDVVLSTDVTFSKVDFTQGLHEITLTVTDNEGAQGTDTVNVRVTDGSDVTPPTVTIATPPLFEVTTITRSIDIVGSVFDDNIESWRLLLSERGSRPDEFVVVAEGTANVDNQTLATLDPTQYLNGQYELILQAFDSNGLEGQENTTVLIDGDLKVGNFSISFEDLSIPTAGIPLTITRTYDTRQRFKSQDFGHGWSLGFENIRVQENRTPGFGWLVRTYPNGPLGLTPDVCVESNTDNIVSVTLSDGEVLKFKAKSEPECNTISPILDVNLVFEALEDDNGAKLEALDNNFGRLVNGSLDDLGSGVIDPMRYKLTTKEGREIIIDQNEGVREIYEPEGENRITISRDGIVHSAGPEITFVRDSDERITQIQSPDGKTLNYEYSDAGDIISFTNRADETTTFTYLSNPNLPHYLEDIIDPRGIRVARNEYDDDGRLSAHIDADGNRIEYTHDIDGRTETVKDRNGNNTTFVYNDRGDVVAQTNAEGETTTHTYNEFGFELSRTDALGNTQTWTYDKVGNQITETDALGNTTTSSYQVFNQFDTQVDALGRTVIDNSYRNTTVSGIPILPGPLTSITDATGNFIILVYNNQGLPRRIIDVGGNASETEYNSSGFITATVDALGVRTDYTVDSMGNRLTETTTRTNAAGETETLTTTHAYDAKDNLIQTTDALGNVTRMEYNSINKMSAEIDANGNRTEYEYDSRGNQVKMTYADGSTATMTYDAENNKISETDRHGQTTTYVYDKVNRLIETILPDATAGDLTDNPRSKTEYDDAGRVSAAIDANGNRTTYGYDAAGRRTSVTDALGNVSTYAYDAVGNQTSFTDANNNTMSYEYDVLDRRTKTTFADGTSKSVAYDALGRKTSETDQAGVITQYAYDALGRLTKITDVQGNETSYVYDEQGNKISQTNAEGRITKWAYDKLGRVVSRTLPLGQVESTVYDAVGNMTSKTDFNGQTASFEYDVNNRLVKSTYADGEIDEITYDAVGNRTQTKQSKSGGVSITSYLFDAQLRTV